MADFNSRFESLKTSLEVKIPGLSAPTVEKKTDNTSVRRQHNPGFGFGRVATPSASTIIDTSAQHRALCAEQCLLTPYSTRSLDGVRCSMGVEMGVVIRVVGL